MGKAQRHINASYYAFVESASSIQGLAARRTEVVGLRAALLAEPDEQYQSADEGNKGKKKEPTTLV